MSRFLPGEQFVCWHNHGSVSETRHLITVGNKSWHVSSQGKGISLLAVFIRNKADSKTEKEKLQNLSRTSCTSWSRSSSDVPPYCVPLHYMSPGAAVFLLYLVTRTFASIHICFAVFIITELKFRESVSTL